MKLLTNNYSVSVSAMQSHAIYWSSRQKPLILIIT